VTTTRDSGTSAASIGNESSSSIGPTAEMPAPTRGCSECKKDNHLGASSCVFCGHPFAKKADEKAKSGVGASPSQAPAPSSPLSSEAASSAAIQRSPMPSAPPSPNPALEVSTADRWRDGSASPSVDDESPPSRRQRTSLDDIVPAQPIADPLIGVIVAERYRILEAIGRGGMGIVYKVEHTRIGKLLAMKLLTGELSRNPDVVRRFKQEALTASKLSSPNTVQVFDFGAAEGLTYLVMELVTGEDLGRLLRGTGPITFARLGKMIIQVCSSLTEAHHHGIVHRDIKPENIMVMRATRDGTDVAKVLDFGLAKLREGSELNDVTSQGAIVGTPYFMAPEQIRGEAVDHRTDIYALGALMYRALTGQYPFTGPTPMAVFTKHLTEEPVSPCTRVPELAIPIGAGEIVLKALQKDPAARWQRIEDLQAALIDEVKSVSTSSVDNLLDSGQLRKLARVAAETEMKSMVVGGAAAAELATRDELLAYERKLRRLKYTAIGSALLLTLALLGLGARVLLWQKAAFAGTEIEPNDSAAEAQLVPFGKSVSGFVGKRLDPTHGDRDFYAVDVPRPAEGNRSLVSIHTSALPNFGTCTFVYKSGFSTALGQYCVGGPKRDLDIPALELEPGRYLVAVLQDLDAYGGVQPFVHENVSDAYTLLVGPTNAEPSFEIEPNDQVATHNAIPAGGTMHGTIGWARDEDVFCVGGSDGAPIRWKVEDGPKRDPESVLEVIAIRGGDEGAAVHVHVAKGQMSAIEVASPWVSPAVPDEGTPRCIRVRLASNPWTFDHVFPRGSQEPYAISVESLR
jgi:tRNA A-37 threonylcarbamoyl transferase component Bud32